MGGSRIALDACAHELQNLAILGGSPVVPGRRWQPPHRIRDHLLNGSYAKLVLCARLNEPARNPGVQREQRSSHEVRKLCVGSDVSSL